MADLFYGVIALKNTEVDQVIAKLNDQKLDSIALWLTQKKDHFYGKRNEDWKPFNGQTISQLVNETKGYQTQTSLIDKFEVKLENYKVVRASPIRIYFIDIFALFLDKYSVLTNKMDTLMAEQKECCLIVSCELSKDSQEELIKACRRVMGEVYDAYCAGKLHRIAMRVDDLRNFRNYLLETSRRDDRPNSALDPQFEERPDYQYETKESPSL